MRNLPARSLPAASRQLSIRFDPDRLRGLNPTDRLTLVTRLGLLLMEAAGVQVEGGDDDEH